MTDSGLQQLTDRIPVSEATVKGRCDLLDERPILDITWRGGFTFRLVFEKNAYNGMWTVYLMELLYNTGDSLFQGSTQSKFEFFTDSERKELTIVNI